MDPPSRCPDCGSGELVNSARTTSLHGEIHAVMCRACDWSADPRMGRPAADRSKNIGLRRRMETDHEGTKDIVADGAPE
jgi:hypothetical protein